MDSTPHKDLISEIAEADPADAVEPAAALADELEASLVDDEAVAQEETPEEGEGPESPPS